MLTAHDIRCILYDNISFPGYAFELCEEARNKWYIKATFFCPDAETGKTIQHSTRKWYVSPHMTQSEIVQTCFKLCLTSMEHEVRENFKYSGRPIFGPHFDVDKLWEIATPENQDVRE